MTQQTPAPRETTAAASPPATADPTWRERLTQQAQRAIEMAAQERLGFWPPDEATAQKTQSIKAELQGVQRQLAPLRKRERELEAQIAKSGDIAALLAEVRRKRIERVRVEREERKQRNAQAREARAAQDKAWRQNTLPHLGRDVSHGLNFKTGDDQEPQSSGRKNGGDDKLQSLGLPLLHDAEEVASALDISMNQLAWLCYHRGAATIDHYNHFTIPKKSGGRRAISSPKTKLRAAQSRLLETVLSRLPIHEAAMAFRAKVNIADNAWRHAGAAVVLRLDLKDFFPSITFRRVKRLFESIGYNEGVATLFTLLTTEAPRTRMSLDGKTYFVALSERFLPQGACTSPALTNALCRRLDARLSGAAQRYGFIYTRYADDLVFSAPDAKAPVLALRDLAARIIADEKFEINPEKTAIMRRHRRQSVTGLVINAFNSAIEQKESSSEPSMPGAAQKESGGEPNHSGNETAAPRISRADFRRFRAFLHRYEKLGREAMTEQLGQDALAYARGYLSFIHMVSPAQEAKIRALHSWLEPGLGHADIGRNHHSG